MIELNQKHLEDAISELEKWLVTSTIELIKIPVFRKAIEKDLKDKNISKERKKNLESTLEMNKTNEKGHRESIDNVTEILKEVYKLRK